VMQQLPRRPRPTTLTPAPSSDTGRPSPPVLGPTPSAEVVITPENGIQIFGWGSPDMERDMRLARDAGFTWVKQMFQWNYIEGKAKGKYEWNEPDRILAAARANGLKVLARVDYSPRWARPAGADPNGNGPPTNYQDFADFMFALASRYRSDSAYGTINAYQIWNEPNLDREWGMRPPNAEEYVSLLKVAYQAVKSADPKALVISAGMSPTTTDAPNARPDTAFVEAMYKAGGQKYFDMLGVHAPGFKASPEMSPDEVAQDPQYNHGERGAGRVYDFRHVEDLRAIMEKYGDADKRIAVLEYGWTSDDRSDSAYKWHAVTEQEKADYIVGAIRYARGHWRPWIGLMSLIYIASPQWTPQNEQYYWSITFPDGSPRAAYDTLKDFLRP
ncbi:MAG: beta-galactosidase, partial [Chloroflexi bacterium]|nr:beta-galactosidase [Chloroflexota bacterium]